jgi:hypothetical protein
MVVGVVSDRSVSDSPTIPLVPKAVDWTNVGMDIGLAIFRLVCQRPISSILSMPAHHGHPMKVYVGPVRRSRRIRGWFAAAAPVKQQHRILISELGIATEGEIIGDEA